MLRLSKICAIITVFLLFSCVDNSTKNEKKDARYGGVLISETKVSFQDRYAETWLTPYKIGESSFVQIFRSVYETLTRINPNTCSLESNLAKTWDINEDGSVFTFHLRTDVSFHNNGSDRFVMNAQDVKDSFDELSIASTKSVGYAKIKDVIKGVVAFNESVVAGKPLKSGVSGVVVVNDSTVRFDLVKSYAPFSELLSNIDFSIFKRDAKNEAIFGTGPFAFDTVYDEQLFLVRNNNYWKLDTKGNRLPYLDTVVFKRFTFFDIETRLDRFLTGQTHLMRGIRTEDISTVMRVLREENDVDFGYESIDNSRLTAIALNNLIPPFDDVNVRKAFNYAFDKNLYIDSVLNGEQWPAKNGLTPAELSPYEKTLMGNEFNLKKAKEYLAKAGYPNGRDFPPVILSVIDAKKHVYGDKVSRTEKVVMEMICKNLNIKLEYKEHHSFHDMFEYLWEGKGMASIHNYTSRYASPESYLNVYNLKIDSSEHIEHDNTMYFRDSVFDSYYNMALKETDKNKRLQLFYKAECRILDQAPIIPVFYGESNRIVSKQIEGLSQINNLGIIDYTNAYFKKETIN